MAEEKCSHWYREHDTDENYWCRDCLINLRTETYWYGSLKFGKINTSFEVDGYNLDLKQLFTDQLGSSVDITNVTFGNNPDRTWETIYVVAFGLGRASMKAYITASKSERFIPLTTYHVVEEEKVVETT
jgi:hypothetical protein